MSQEELKSLYSILQAILQNDNKIRSQAEEQLKAWFTNPYKFMISLIKISQFAGEDYIRKLSSVLFKRYIGQDNATTIWNQLSSTEQNDIKSELLKSLQKETNKKVIKQISQAISEIAGLIFGSQKEWIELDVLINAYISGDDNLVEIALNMLTCLFSNNAEQYIDKTELFSKQFGDIYKNKTSPIILQSLSIALCTLVSEIDSSSGKPLYKFSENVIKSINAVFVEGNEENLHDFLEILADVAEGESTFFKKTINPLCELMIQISLKKDFINDKLRHMALEILVSIFEQHPELVKKHKAQLCNLSFALFEVMIFIEKDIDPSWLSPKEGYNTEDDLNPDDNVNFGMMSFDRLLSTIEEEDMLPIMEKIMEIGLSQPDWRYRNAAFMAIAQIGEYIFGPEKVKNVVAILISNLTNANPKVRFAALYAIGLLSDDMSPDFQEAFDKQLIAPLIAAVDDPIPRVKSHACAALTNFLEHVKQPTAAEVAPILLPKLIKLITEGISIIKENAMTCIASIAESCDKSFAQYYKELFPFIILCIKQATSREYWKFRGQAIECLTVMSVAVGKSVFIDKAPEVIDLLVEIQNAELSKDNPQKFYLLGAWQRITLILGKSIGPYLDKILPRLLSIAESPPEISIKENSKPVTIETIIQEINPSAKKSGKADLTTSEIEEKEMAMEMITVFATRLEEVYAPYVEQSMKIVIPLLNFSANSELRRSSTALLPSLLKCIVKYQSKQAGAVISFGKQFILQIIDAHEKELNNEIKSTHLTSLKQILEITGHFMTIEDVNALFAKIYGYMKESNKRKAKIIKKKKQNVSEEKEIDEDEMEEGIDAEAENSIEQEDNYQKNVTYFIGAIISTHKEESLPHIPNIIKEIIEPNLEGTVSTKKISLFMADDLIEYVGAEYLGKHNWNYLSNLLLTYATASEHDLRQAACYGLGILAKTSGVLFSNISMKCLQALSSAIDVKEDKKFHYLWAGARDNAISAVGKIMKYQRNLVPFQDIWVKWVCLLPITEDEGEAKEAHEFFIETIINNLDQFVGTHNLNLENTVRICSIIMDTELINEKAKTNIRELFKLLVKNQEIQAEIEKIYQEKLSENQKKKLEKIIKENN